MVPFDTRFLGVAADGELLPNVGLGPKGEEREWPEWRTLWRDALDGVAAEVRGGEAGVRPMKGACEFCELRGLCRVGPRHPMSAPAADAAERAAALDPTRSFIVQAPAGSGKTELLTRRVLTLLARVDEPEQVLAITFTRKAAAEMRHRVVEALARAASGEAPANEYEAEGLALARAALERDAARGWRLLDDPGRLAMRTIDSLATALAHRLPVVSALGAAVATVDDPRPLHLEAAERFLDHHLETIERVALQTRQPPRSGA